MVERSNVQTHCGKETWPQFSRELRHANTLSRAYTPVASGLRAIQVFQQLLYADPGFKRASEVHLRLALMFKVLKQYDTSLKHFKLTLADSNPCICSQPEIRLHVAHLHEVQGKYKQAKEAYETFIQRDHLTPALKAAGLRQLGATVDRDLEEALIFLHSTLVLSYNASALTSMAISFCGDVCFFMKPRCTEPV
ncbi:lysine-specific demethylase 6a-like [Plakobranchus ocellatus]|uniref:Lysine-specific demethylase 6a-like n=1 Tax=Plakobranchus ocellatus TaxID=259542 RepID=A0AAV3YS26_9GAST|nr:lysine-specific demethylase 6a-like [Plakobranchus ocellatus]